MQRKLKNVLTASFVLVCLLVLLWLGCFQSCPTLVSYYYYYYSIIILCLKCFLNFFVSSYKLTTAGVTMQTIELITNLVFCADGTNHIKSTRPHPHDHNRVTCPHCLFFTSPDFSSVCPSTLQSVKQAVRHTATA